MGWIRRDSPTVGYRFCREEPPFQIRLVLSIPPSSSPSTPPAYRSQNRLQRRGCSCVNVCTWPSFVCRRLGPWANPYLAFFDSLASALSPKASLRLGPDFQHPYQTLPSYGPLKTIHKTPKNRRERTTSPGGLFRTS